MLQATVVCASPSLRVRARIRLELDAAQDDNGLRLRGSIHDDLDLPLRQRELQVRVEGPGRPQLRNLHSDDAGGVATLFGLPLDHYKVVVAFEGDEFYERSELTQSVDPQRSQLELVFSAPEARRVRLDEPITRLALQASSMVGGRGLSVAVRDELARLVATGTTDADGRVSFDVPSARLGEPGLGELVAESQGDTTRAAARVSKPLLRTRATHTALRANWDRAAQRLHFRLRLATQAGPLAQKAVGVFVDATHLVTLVTDRNGEAQRSLDVKGTVEQGAHRVVARFESDAAGLDSSESQSLPLEVTAPTQLSAAWLIAPVLVSVVFAFWSTRRAKRAEDPDELAPSAAPAVRLGASLRGRSALYALDGSVQDIDSGAPLTASLYLTGASHQVIELQADRAGRFVSAALAVDSYHVRVWAPGYATTEFDVRVPHIGTGSGIRVSLRSLRAAALDAHAPVARRVLRSEARLQVATVRDALKAAVSGARAGADFALLTELVEQVAYARPTPHDRDLHQVERAAAAVLADLDAQSTPLSDPNLE
jgi:hypothetical protein